jgi:hypothetical protein
MYSKKQAHTQFCFELHAFLQSIATPGSIVTSREVKCWVKGLDATHPVKVSYNLYVDLCGQSRSQQWQLDDFNRIANHMKYIPGFQRQFAYVKRSSTGRHSRTVKVYKNQIKM